VMFGEGEGTLSVYLTNLNESTNVVEFFATDDRMLLIVPAKNTEKRRTSFRLGALPTEDPRA